MKKANYIIFTDLDGTLLDHDTYSFSEALPALTYIKQQKIPLILASSKTRVEMAGYQKEFGIEEYPFIVENGSAVYTSKAYFSKLSGSEPFKSYTRYCLGKTYEEIKNILIKVSEENEYIIRGFHNTNKQEIIDRTKLSPEAVELALHREFSIPLFYDDRVEKILLKEIQKYNLQILYGGRFMHILGKTDKGKALELVVKGYQKETDLSDAKTIAIGDTLNDVAMLQKADIKILVKRYNGRYDARVQIDNLIYSPYIGSKGWSSSILRMLKPGEKNE